MKKLTLVLCIILSVLSCNNDDDNINETPVLLGNWHLVEVLADPGDGSGVFMPVNSAKTISFFSNNTVVSNGSICSMFIEGLDGSTGTYNANNEITVDDCPFFNAPLVFELVDEGLIVHYQCIEQCSEKYIKIN